MISKLIAALCVFYVLIDSAFARNIDKFGQGFGINIKTERITDVELKKITDLGVDRVRISIVKGYVENDQGYSWNRALRRDVEADDYNINKNYTYDGMIESIIKNHNLHIDITLDDGSENPPEQSEVSDFAKFAAETVQHYTAKYGSTAFTWHIWNEPNPDYANPSVVGDLLQKSCQAIKQAAPDAEVMGPALLAVGDGDFDYDFIEHIFSPSVNPLKCLDAFTVHPYRSSEPETAADDSLYYEIDGRSERADYPTLKSHFERYKLGANIAVDEWGYTLTPAKKGTTAWTWRQYADTAQAGLEQAALILRMYLTNIASDIPLTVIYEWRNSGPDLNNDEHNYGIIGFYNDRKAAYSMFLNTWPKLLDRPYIGYGEPTNCDGKKVNWIEFGNKLNDNISWMVVWTYDRKKQHIVNVKGVTNQILDIFGHPISSTNASKLVLTGIPLLLKHKTNVPLSISCRD